MKPILKRWRAGVITAALALSLGTAPVIPAQMTSAAGTPSFSDVAAGHWAFDTIGWGIRGGIVSGYEDGTFKPDRPVAESEFLAMLLRAFPVVNIPAGSSASDWYAPYYTYASGQHWPVVRDTTGAGYNRGLVAKLIAATQGQALDVRASIQLLLARGLSNGKTSATVDGYMASDKLSRAEALQFIRNLISANVSLSAAPRPSTSYQVAGISIGDAEADVILQLGAPARKDVSEYGFTWYVYNRDYASFAMVGIQDGRVVALHSNSANWKGPDGIAPGVPYDTIRAAVSGTLDALMKLGEQPGVKTVYKPEHTLMTEADGSYTTVFFDIHSGNTAAALLQIDKKVEDARQKLYPVPSEALRSVYERQLFDMANAARSRQGLAPFEWDEAIAGTARKFSKAMADGHFFEHVDPSTGQSPGDRASADGIVWSAAAENIAAGQPGAVYAHEAWMNSAGHRANLLGKTKRLGVGVYFGGDMNVYYTQDFYAPRS